MWTARLYSNTGLNTVNILDKPSRLDSADYLDVPALDIIQGEHLSSVSIKATRAQVVNVDYLRLSNGDEAYYYVVNGYFCTSLDVVKLDITLDAMLTLTAIVNGINNITWLDGIVERHHVPKSADTFGAFNEPDPLLVPSKELAADVSYLFRLDVPITQQKHIGIIESTLDLPAMADDTDARTYTDPDSGQSVTVPNTRASGSTYIDLYNVPAARGYYLPGSALFDYNNQKVRDGIQRARALGVEGGILNSYLVPKGALYEVNTSIDSDGRYNMVEGNFLEESISGMPFEYANVDNKRVLYGELNAIELHSMASGMSMRYKPEEIDGDTSAPVLIAIYDPRPDGRPYFRPRYYRGVDMASAMDGAFLAQAVAGAQWANAPLAYTGKSGSALDEIRYNTDKIIASNDVDAAFDILAHNTENAVNRRAGGGAAQSIGQILTGDIIGGIASTAGTWFDTTEMIENYEIAQREATRRYKQAALKEMEIFMLNTQVVAPQIHFPNSATLRDFIGNGLCVVRYRPTNSDIAKLDKILSMYGYKDTIAIDKAIFSNRKKYNYVKINGASIGGNAPRWIREMAAAQLSSGCRIWHQLPDVTAYTDGSNT